MNATLRTFAALLALARAGVVASPLDEARASRVVNEVTATAPHGKPRHVAGNEIVRADEALHVGAQSRTEMTFADSTVARLGAETDVSFRRGTRELTLGRGTLLLQVAGWRGGARIKAGALTAVCGGATILIEHLPAQSVKVVVVEGDLRIATGGFLGDSIVLPPGKMLITGPDVKRLPEPVDVDLSTLIRTSALIDPERFAPGATPLASSLRIAREIERQAGSVKVQRLIPTNLAIVGSGTNVVIPAAPEAEMPSAVAAEETAPGNEEMHPKLAKVGVRQGGSASPADETPLPQS